MISNYVGCERMGYKLCITEKYSVAKEIAPVIGATKPCNGYFEGNGYRVAWAHGHLVGLAEPEEYGFVSKKDMWGEGREKAYAELPIIPEEFNLVVLEETKDLFETIKNLIHSPDTDEIINCGDMGPEGHILQWFIREKAGCTKKVRRFCATSMTKEAILDAMAHLQPEEKFANIIKGEFCKKKADWIMGMSMSRAESLKYRTGINVGRVQSPTLYFVVKRYLEVKKFKVTNYFGMDAQLAEGFHVFWSRDTKGVFPEKVKDTQGRVLDKDAVNAKRIQIEQGRTGIVTELIKKKRGNDRPQLLDILELQKLANRKYGYTAAETLDIAQALYESPLAILSYPRTDSRYITSDLEPYMKGRIKSIAKIGKYKEEANALLVDGLNIDSKIVDDTKVTDHHALIVTENIDNFDMSTLGPTAEQKKKGVTAEKMRNILDLVICRMIVSFSKPFYYEQTDVAVQFTNGMIFTATGKKPIQLGWTAVEERLSGKEVEEKTGEEDEEQLFPEIVKGQTVTVRGCTLVSKKTTPPKLHTEATLLTAMMNAGATVENGAILAGRGIGTQATRGEIIKKLFDSGYVTNMKKGKTNYIVPTAKGQTIIRVLPKELYSPKITADWETKIALIADGKMTEQEFMDDFTKFIHEKVREVKETDTGIVFSAEREAVGECPWCGSDLWRFEEKDAQTNKVVAVKHYCSNKGHCAFSLKTNDLTVTTWAGKKMTEKQLQKLIAYGFIVLTCKNRFQNGKDYKAKFSIIRKEVDGKIYANLHAESVKKKGK